MKTTRKWYLADFKAKVALEAIRRDLTLAELGAKQGIHHKLIAAWKRQAIDGMASTFAGASEVARANGEAEIDRLHEKACPGESRHRAAGRGTGRNNQCC